MALALAAFLFVLLLILANAALFYDSVDPEEVTLRDLLIVLGPLVAAVVLPGAISLVFLVCAWRWSRKGQAPRRWVQLAIIGGFALTVGSSLVMMSLR